MQPSQWRIGQAVAALKLTNHYQPIALRKITAIFICFAFLISQYARQLSYLECRLSNYFALNGKGCDCETLLVEKGKSPAATPGTVIHQHLHIDEIYTFPQLLQPIASANNICIKMHFRIQSSIHEGYPAGIDRPPAIN